ncbi:DUF5819 family protein [Curtobacterium sp. 1P10AnD]|uniref:DUF5819 family protein n=1 Tax=Curtobacterium sp. 1P10AnD TaxID=3132283 RepID=UPI0039A34B6E
MQKAFMAAVGLFVTGTFGACAVVLAGPVTPIKFDVGPIASLLNPHISQNWQLFAPDPISDERGVVARIRCSSSEETDWMDISSSAIARTQSSRLFPDRESRIVSNALVERFARDDIGKRLEANGKENLAPTDDRAQRRAERVLARYAAHLIRCPSPGPGEEASAVQLRYVVQPLAPWSKRNENSTRVDPRTTDSEWIAL